MRLALAGDTMLGRGVAERLTADPKAPLFAPEVVEFASRAASGDDADWVGRRFATACSALGTEVRIEDGRPVGSWR